MTSPLDQIDRLLEEWTARAARIDQNLVDLTAEPAFEAVERAQFDGASHQRVAEARTELARLFEQRRLLEDVIDRARAIRATVTALRHGRRLVEIEALLQGPSIALPANATPVTERGLLDPDEIVGHATPADVLDRMTASFERVRDVVHDVAAAWSALPPAVAEAEAELRGVEGACRAAGPGVVAQYEQVTDAVATARRLVETDPLGAAPAAVRVLAGNLAALRRRLPTPNRATPGAGGGAGPG